MDSGPSPTDSGVHRWRSLYSCSLADQNLSAKHRFRHDVPDEVNRLLLEVLR